MGYCARDGSGDGKANYMPRVASLDHVADANARLSLTGKTAGYQCIQDADSGSGAGVTYTYNGASTADNAGIRVSGDTPLANGVYPVSGTSDGKNTYLQIGGEANTLLWNAGHADWESPNLLSTDDTTYPWQAVFANAVVERDDIASLANWTPAL